MSLLLAASVGGGVDYLFAKLGNLIVVFVVLVALALLFKVGASRYKKVPPDQALVVYGGGKTNIVTGGAVFVIPLLKDTFILNLSSFQVALELTDVPNKDRIPTTVHANATCRIANDENLLQTAARVFGRCTQDHVKETIKNALEGHLRIIIGQMDMDTILSKRDEFNAKVQSEAATELEHLGCKIDILNIQKVTDAHQIIEAMGKPMAAKVKAEAMIQEAEQTKRQTIETSNREKEAKTTKNSNDQEIAKAEQGLSIKKAGLSAEVAKAEAEAAQAGPLATATASKAVRVASVEAEEAETQARIKLQDSVGKLTEAELNATVLKKADAEKARLKTVAEGEAAARTISATAEATALKTEAEGQAEKTRRVGTAEAEMVRTRGQADADATKARLTAEAEGQTAGAEAEKAKLLAQADGKKALLLAEAEGARALNEAYKGLDPEQRKLFVIGKITEATPAIIEAVGKAGKEIVGELAQVLTASLSSIDNITVYDTGGANGQGGALERMASVGPDTLFRLMKNLKASGMDKVISTFLQKTTGVDLETLTGAPIVDAEVTATTGAAATPPNGGVSAK